MRNKRIPTFRPVGALTREQRLAQWRRQETRQPRGSAWARGYDKDWQQLR
jgi:hypothetical protein